MNTRIVHIVRGMNKSATGFFHRLLVCGLLGSILGTARAATWTVTTLSDIVPGSLRAAISNSVAGDIILFTNGLTGTIALTNGELVIAHDLAILGPGAARLAISGLAAGRVLAVTNGNVVVAGLTLRDGLKIGLTNSPGAMGGGVFNSASLVLSNCFLFNNLAAGADGTNGVGGISAKPGSAGGQALGGGIYNNGVIQLVNCTLAQNEARGGRGGNGGAGGDFGGRGGAGGPAFGGAICNDGFLTNVNCTFSTNRATGGGGGSGQAGGLIDGNGGNGANAEGAAVFNRNVAQFIHVSLINNIAQSGTGGTTVMPGNGTNGAPGDALGGGMYAATNTTYLVDTLAALNLLQVGAATNNGWDVFGPVLSQGFNLIGATNGSSGWSTNDLTGSGSTPLDPFVGPLQFNGGQTQTHALLTNSPAIDRGTAAGWYTDQRGGPRPFDVPFAANAPMGDGSDIGAYEWTTMDVWLAPGRASYWWDTLNWSAGLPEATFSVLVTNSGTRGAPTLVIVDDSAPTNSLTISDLTIGQTVDTNLDEVQVNAQFSSSIFHVLNNLNLLPGGSLIVSGSMPLQADGTTTIAGAAAADPAAPPGELTVYGGASARLADVDLGAAGDAQGNLNVSSGSLIITGTLSAGTGVPGVFPSYGQVAILGPSTFIHTNQSMRLGTEGTGGYYQDGGTALCQGAFLGGPGPYSSGNFSVVGGLFVASESIRLIGHDTASFGSSLDVSGAGFYGPGSVYVTNATRSAFLEVGDQSVVYVRPGGLLQVDGLILTNGGAFTNLGGTFQITTSAAITNGSASFQAGTNDILGSLNINSASGATAVVSVSSSVLNISSNLVLSAAPGSPAAIAISSNGQINVSADVIVRSGDSVTPGALAVSSGSSLRLANGTLSVGPAGAGLMTINGGTVIAPKIHLGGAGASGKVIFSSGFVRTSELICNWWIGDGGDQDGNGGTMLLGDLGHDAIYEIHASAVSTNWGEIDVGYGAGFTGAFTNDGGVVSVTNSMIIGNNTVNATGLAALSGSGELYVTNSAHTAVLDVRQGSFIMTGGKLVVDILRVTNNGTGTFIRTGGQLLAAQRDLDPNQSAVGDGVHNGWKLNFGFDPFDPAVAGADPDHDGMSNRAEFLAGTDPTSAASVLRMLGVARINAQDTRVDWTTVAGHSYVVQTNGDLTKGIFADLSPVIPAVGTGEGTANYIHSGGATNRALSYRVRLAP